MPKVPLCIGEGLALQPGTSQGYVALLGATGAALLGAHDETSICDKLGWEQVCLERMVTSETMINIEDSLLHVCFGPHACTDPSSCLDNVKIKYFKDHWINCREGIQRHVPVRLANPWIFPIYVNIHVFYSCSTIIRSKFKIGFVSKYLQNNPHSMSPNTILCLLSGKEQTLLCKN